MSWLNQEACHVSTSCPNLKTWVRRIEGYLPLSPRERPKVAGNIANTTVDLPAEERCEKNGNTHIMDMSSPEENTANLIKQSTEEESVDDTLQTSTLEWERPNRVSRRSPPPPESAFTATGGAFDVLEGEENEGLLRKVLAGIESKKKSKAGRGSPSRPPPI